MKLDVTMNNALKKSFNGVYVPEHQIPFLIEHETGDIFLVVRRKPCYGNYEADCILLRHMNNKSFWSAELIEKLNLDTSRVLPSTESIKLRNVL